MAISTAIYGSRIEADEYFLSRLHETAWSAATTPDQDKALIAASRGINKLAFKGNKATVHALLLADPAATCEEIRAAEAAQELEFPRGDDTTIPEDIRIAQYEEAYSLLNGEDPELEYEALQINSQKIESVQTGFDRKTAPSEHLINGFSSLAAWRRLKPFLRDSRSLKLLRV